MVCSNLTMTTTRKALDSTLRGNILDFGGKSISRILIATNLPETEVILIIFSNFSPSTRVASCSGTITCLMEQLHYLILLANTIQTLLHFKWLCYFVGKTVVMIVSPQKICAQVNYFFFPLQKSISRILFFREINFTNFCFFVKSISRVFYTS